MPVLPTRKLINLLWGYRVLSDKERPPRSLQECLHSKREQRGGRRIWIILLISLLLLFLYNNVNFTNTPKDEESIMYQLTLINNVTQNTNSLFYASATTVYLPTTSRAILHTFLPPCRINITGPVRVAVTRNIIKPFDKLFPMVNDGGYYLPSDCISRHKVAVLVPYRDRKTNLALFLNHMHPFLMKQNLEYRIFVIEQNGTDKYNKGRLFNAGFKEMQKIDKFKCVTFHDVDLLPLDRRILYTCPSWPRHMCATVIQKNYDPNYLSLFGGVTSLTLQQYEAANGYSNRFWDWGGEDDDMFWRLRAAGYPVMRYNREVAKYLALPHPKQKHNLNRYKLLRKGRNRFKEEGLSTVEYKVLSKSFYHLFTHILVDINPKNIINATFHSIQNTSQASIISHSK